ncbi:hypothetical protein ACH5RR_028323 [Cinchona calisaya]|uniref:RNase H type-1 domain-containing protein n=1 Tax=Cinchona calisaya TaxID=153742 RepID=A0ABD2YSV9_9GENT
MIDKKKTKEDGNQDIAETKRFALFKAQEGGWQEMVIESDNAFVINRLSTAAFVNPGVRSSKVLTKFIDLHLNNAEEEYNNLITRFIEDANKNFLSFHSNNESLDTIAPDLEVPIFNHYGAVLLALPMALYASWIGIISVCVIRVNLGGFLIGVLAGNWSIQDLDLWVMKEYGVQESWKKRFSIESLPNIYLPLCFRNNEEELFIENKDGQLISCVLSNCQEFRKYDVCEPSSPMVGYPPVINVVTYRESLISIQNEITPINK